MIVVMMHGLFNYMIQNAEGVDSLSYENNPLMNCLVDNRDEHKAIKIASFPQIARFK
jgi:hypothetical protein